MNDTMSEEQILSHNIRCARMGWCPVEYGKLLYKRGGRVYDLSAADLNQLPRIEREGLFLVDNNS